MKTKLERALSYAKKGISVIPLCWITDKGVCSCKKGEECSSPGKHPKTKNGYKDGSADEDVITAWWEKYPDANIGIVTGKATDIIVIDIDPRNGGNETLKKLIAEYGELPDTCIVKTGGGGRHYYFKYPTDIKTIKSSLGQGVDIKADGGYVVAPNSNHISGGNYRWKKGSMTGFELAELPAPWVKCLTTQISDNGSLAKNKIPEIIIEGERNNTLFDVAARLRATGFDEDEITSMLRIANERCVKPLKESELSNIAASVMRYEAGVSQIKQWCKPKPLDNIKLPEFPMDCFPPSIRDYIESVAKSIQVPLDMAACA
ncbi:MAG: bifunctional DNA primase/polymerase, partial [Bacillota bacterium]